MEAEKRDLLIAGELLSSLNNKILIERNYLPRDVINETHVLQVFNEYKYKTDLINKEIQSMKQLKRSFKLCARDVIEKSYINAANKLGWCNDSK